MEELDVIGIDGSKVMHFGAFMHYEACQCFIVGTCEYRKALKCLKIWLSGRVVGLCGRFYTSRELRSKIGRAKKRTIQSMRTSAVDQNLQFPGDDTGVVDDVEVQGDVVWQLRISTAITLSSAIISALTILENLSRGTYNIWGKSCAMLNYCSLTNVPS